MRQSATQCPSRDANDRHKGRSSRDRSAPELRPNFPDGEADLELRAPAQPAQAVRPRWRGPLRATEFEAELRGDTAASDLSEIERHARTIGHRDCCGAEPAAKTCSSRLHLTAEAPTARAASRPNPET